MRKLFANRAGSLIYPMQILQDQHQGLPRAIISDDDRESFLQPGAQSLPTQVIGQRIIVTGDGKQVQMEGMVLGYGLLFGR